MSKLRISCYLLFILIKLVRMLPVVPENEPVSFAIFTGVIGLCLFFSLADSGKNTRLLALLLWAAGSVLLVLSGSSILHWALGLHKMTDVLVLLILIRLLGFPLETGSLHDFVGQIVLQIKKENTNYLVILALTIVFASLVNFAIVPLIYFLVVDPIRSLYANWERFLATCLKRGLSLALFWSPFGIIMAITLEYTGSLWIDVFPLGLSLSLGGVFLAAMLHQLVESGSRSSLPPYPKTNSHDSTLKIAGLTPYLVYLLLLLGSVFVLNSYFHLSTIRSIILTALIFPPLWSLLFKWGKPFKNRLVEYGKKDIPAMYNSFAIFISAGILVSGLEQIRFLELAAPLVLSIKSYSLLLLLLTIPLLIMLISMTGMHPIVSVVIFLENIQPELIGVDTELFAFLVVAGGSLGVLISPFAGTSLLLAEFLKRSPVQVATRWNLLYTALVFLLITVITLVYL